MMMLSNVFYYGSHLIWLININNIKEMMRENRNDAESFFWGMDRALENVSANENKKNEKEIKIKS
jgi:hypothetical protein